MSTEVIGRGVALEVIGRAQDTEVIERDPGTEVVDSPEGPIGPPGPAGGVTIQKAAAQALSGHKVVRPAPGDELDIASADDASDAGFAIGVTIGAAEAGATATAQTAGELVEPSWSWSIGPVFLGLAGALTQSPPAAAFLQQIGVAVAPDRLFINIRPPILTPS